jgi:hypothetical protein
LEGKEETMNGLSVLVMILVLSFAIERLVKAVLFLLSFSVLQGPETIEDPGNRIKAEKRQTLIFFALAGFLGLIVIALYGDIRVLKALGYESKKGLDAFVTGIVLMGGSDFIGKVLDISGIGGATASKAQPIEITGKLVLEGGAGGGRTTV